jgi:hypothetical protein
VALTSPSQCHLLRPAVVSPTGELPNFNSLSVCRNKAYPGYRDFSILSTYNFLSKDVYDKEQKTSFNNPLCISYSHLIKFLTLLNAPNLEPVVLIGVGHVQIAAVVVQVVRVVSIATVHRRRPVVGLRVHDAHGTALSEPAIANRPAIIVITTLVALTSSG